MKKLSIFTSAALALALSSLACATQIVVIPSLPAAPIVPVPMIPTFPTHSDRLIPGKLPTRSVPGYPVGLPSLPFPTISLPGPMAPEGRISLPGPQIKSRVSLPATAVATGKIILASHGAPSAQSLKRLFDNAQGSKQAPVIEDDADEISPVKGDSSHLTLPESDLEIEIGIRR